LGTIVRHEDNGQQADVFEVREVLDLEDGKSAPLREGCLSFALLESPEEERSR
jgi:hypothetical protein